MNIGFSGFSLFHKAIFITVKMNFIAVSGFKCACTVFFSEVSRFRVLGVVGMFVFLFAFVLGFNDTGINYADTTCFDDDVLVGKLGTNVIKEYID